MTNLQLASLKALAHEMDGEGSAAPLAYARFAQLDKQFHDEIARAAANELVEEALSRLHTHVHLFRLMYHATVTGEAVKEHAAIIEAFERRDPDAAVMRDHIRRSRDRFLSTL
jgi:DNA-binding GntR family transcriptional regulator